MVKISQFMQMTDVNVIPKKNKKNQLLNITIVLNCVFKTSHIDYMFLPFSEHNVNFKTIKKRKRLSEKNIIPLT